MAEQTAKLNYKAEEIDNILESVGTQTDTPDSKGSAFARISNLVKMGTLNDLLTAFKNVSYNGDGTWTANGITDMTYNDMLTALTESMGYLPSGWSYRLRFANSLARTILIPKKNSCLQAWCFNPSRYGNPAATPDCFRMFYASYKMETIVMCNMADYGFGVGNANGMFYGSAVRRIINASPQAALDLSYITDAKYANDMFRACTKLEEVKISFLKVSLSFADSPNLNKDSILFMVKYSAGTSAKTITLHPTAYAMAIADSDIQAALQEKTNVSLAQAE